jgi:hypothetical protein
MANAAPDHSEGTSFKNIAGVEVTPTLGDLDTFPSCRR